MKNKGKALGLIALAAVIGFSLAACGGDDDDDNSGGGNGGGNGSLGNTLTITDVQVYSMDWDENGILQFKPFTGTVANLNYVRVSGRVYKSLNELIDGNPTVTLVNGKLNVTLGMPKASSLENFNPHPSVSVSTTGVKIFSIQDFCGDHLYNDASVSQVRTDGQDGGAIYWYSNKDVNINGKYTDEYDGVVITVAMNLKAGWNSIIGISTGTGLSFKTGMPNTDYKWMLDQPVQLPPLNTNTTLNSLQIGDNDNSVASPGTVNRNTNLAALTDLCEVILNNSDKTNAEVTLQFGSQFKGMARIARIGSGAIITEADFTTFYYYYAKPRFDFTDGDKLYVKLTAENGTTVMYYGFVVKIED